MAIAHVGTSTTASGTGTSASATYSPVSGNLLVAWVRVAVTGSSAFVTQSGWTAGTVATGGTNRYAMYYKLAGSGETSENPLQWTGSVAWTMIVDEYSAVASSSSLDTENNAANASATPLTTPIVTPTASVERLVSCGAVGGVVTYTTDQVNASATGVTARATVSGNHAYDLVVASTSGTYQGRTTPSATGTSEISGIAMFKGYPIRVDERVVLQAVRRAAYW